MSRLSRLRIGLALTTGILLLVLLPAVVFAQGPDEHPFMLVREDQYPELRQRADQEPWRTMKGHAIAECNALAFPRITASACLGSDAFCMHAIMGSCSLAYILDPANSAVYLEKVRSAIPYWEPILVVQSGADDGSRNTTDAYYTDATAAYFNTILAVDVMHDDLALLAPLPSPVTPSPWTTPPVFDSSLDQAETCWRRNIIISTATRAPFLANTSITCPTGIRHARSAAMIAWKIYAGEFSPTDSDSVALLQGGMLDNKYPDLDRDGDNVEGYMPEISARINSSGVYSEGSTYAHAGWGLDRDERSHLVDILEFTGKDVAFGVDFYTNPRFQNFYEWLYGYASTPYGVMTGFGDTYAFDRLTDDGHGGNVYTESSHIGQAGKFSDLAGGYALWKSRGSTPQGRFLNYVLLEPMAPASPQSRVFANGGGFFLESPADDRSLYGALWNVMQPEVGSPVFHVRDDVNAVYIAGYGESLLMNSGFCGAVDTTGPSQCQGKTRTA